MIGGSGAGAVEVIPQNCFLSIGQPLVLEIVSERAQITIYQGVPSQRWIGQVAIPDYPMELDWRQ